MKISEIDVLEKANTNSIYLLKVGLFYRAYELNENENVAHILYRGQSVRKLGRYIRWFRTNICTRTNEIPSVARVIIFR
jgi:hypothetical protein